VKMDVIAGSQNDEHYTPPYAVAPILEFVRAGSRVWCPFDTSDSYFVKMLTAHGCDVTATHIESGDDFFSMPVPQVDCVVSNPPYTKKTEVFARLFTLGIPFAMLVGVVGLFESQRRFQMFAANKFEILYLNKRVAFFKSFAEQKPSLNPPFSSVYLTSKLLPDRIMFREIGKTVKPQQSS
jgi:hypothetical protein